MTTIQRIWRRLKRVNREAEVICIAQTYVNQPISVGDSVHLNIFGIPESGVAGGMNQNVRRRN